MAGEDGSRSVRTSRSCVRSTNCAIHNNGDALTNAQGNRVHREMVFLVVMVHGNYLLQLLISRPGIC